CTRVRGVTIHYFDYW
nr:immunoglobulin heavy chain junction region [Macaca mulatta]